MYLEAFFLTIPLAFSAKVTITSKAKCFLLVISLWTKTCFKTYNLIKLKKSFNFYSLTLMHSSKTWSNTDFKNFGASSAISIRHFCKSSLSVLSSMLDFIF